VSPRSDIYSLGATLYHLLTGVIPFGTSYINAKSHPNLELPEIPSLARQCGLPSELDRVISKALSKNPALRQQSVKQLFEEFYAVMSSRSVSLPGELKGDQAVKYD
jgi:serine/threonine-protein kinase